MREATDRLDPILSVEEVSVEYPGSRRRSKHRALDGVSVEVERGQTVAVVGESGAGKSTLGRAVLGLVPVSAGRIQFEGADITRASRAERRRIAPRLSVVFQDPYSSLNPARTVHKSLVEPLLSQGVRSRLEAERRVERLLELVGLELAVAKRYPRQFSGGQCQRLAIARALMTSPHLVVLDEPLSALDLSVQAQILNLLVDLREEFGLAYLFIGHDLSVVRHLAHRVVVLKNGRVVEAGDTETVCTAPSSEYTKSLLVSAPVPDPVLQRARMADRVAALAAGVPSC